MPDVEKFSPELEKHLAHLAIAASADDVAHLREAIRSEIEDIIDVWMADQVMERIRSGEEKTISLYDIGKELGLED